MPPFLKHNPPIPVHYYINLPMIPKTQVTIIPSTHPLTQKSSSTWPISTRPRTSPRPSSSTSTTYPLSHSGPSLRGLLRGLRPAQPGQDLEIHRGSSEVPDGQEVRRKCVLPLHLPSLRQVHQLRPPRLRIPRNNPAMQVVIEKRTPEEAFQPFSHIDFRPFRDAGYGQCSYKCTVTHQPYRSLIACADCTTPSG
jgi:hypothetical protein